MEAKTQATSGAKSSLPVLPPGAAPHPQGRPNQPRTELHTQADLPVGDLQDAARGPFQARCCFWNLSLAKAPLGCIPGTSSKVHHSRHIRATEPWADQARR
jgi:hypothetical protein